MSQLAVIAATVLAVAGVSRLLTGTRVTRRSCAFPTFAHPTRGPAGPPEARVR